MFLASVAGMGLAQQAANTPATASTKASSSKGSAIGKSVPAAGQGSATATGKTASATGKTSATTAARPHAAAGKKTTASAKHRRSRKGSWKRKGQQVIASDRTREIQEALIREHYLTGEPTGKWDARTEAAMVKYQADNGWQSKVTPDSRALIKLGLGPDYSKQNLNTAATKSPAVAANSSAGQDK